MRLLRSTLSWTHAVFGLLLAYVAIIELDSSPVFRDGFPPEWPRALPLALLALIPPLAFVLALRSLRYAGLLRLAAAPLLGASSVWHPGDLSGVSSAQSFLGFSLFFNAQFSHREADVQAGEAWGGALYAGPQALPPQRFRQAH